MFRYFFQSDPMRQVSRRLAKGSFFGGMVLIGLGLLVWLLKDIFAIIAMIIFFVAGFSAIGYSIKLFFTQYRMRHRGDLGPNITDAHFEDR
ncbi:MAG: hypothetical protein LLF76_04450 [Planctomycetaceae bacterium]|nr:hypothetical protein [Planctomycetaceae bacterium]